MALHKRVKAALKTAMKERDTTRLSTLRLINAAIKDQEIARRSNRDDGDEGLTDEDILKILAKMTKQRQESARAYEEAGRLDLAGRENDEITVIEEFLPQKLSDDEVEQAITSAIDTVQASSIRDMGKIMAHLKTRHTGQMDFGVVGGMLKRRLCNNGAGSA